jgi:5-formyltetrahydrofolate cyclo-ligase
MRLLEIARAGQRFVRLRTLMSDRAERQALRRRFRRARRALASEVQTQHDLAIARHFFASGLATRADCIALYVANDGEVDLEPLALRLARVGKRLALPVVRSAPGRSPHLEFYRWAPGAAMMQNRYGILEPAPGAAFVPALALGLVLVPLVAFDNHGTRLGMGSGFYDRFLGALPPSLRPYAVGVAHELQRSTAALPKSDRDIPLDGVITEQGWQRLPA